MPGKRFGSQSSAACSCDDVQALTLVSRARCRSNICDFAVGSLKIGGDLIDAFRGLVVGLWFYCTDIDDIQRSTIALIIKVRRCRQRFMAGKA